MLRLAVGVGGTVGLVWAGSLLHQRYQQQLKDADYDHNHLAHCISIKTIIDDIGDNQSLFSKEELDLFEELIKLGQVHLFQDWPPAGELDDDKRSFAAQLMVLHRNYAGGLPAYIKNARALLRDSKEGKNPFEGYVPEVPDGVRLDYGSEAFLELEQTGIQEAGTAAFVLVAGGLGERLGYSGIKVALPVESASRRPFLQLYIEHILALQRKSAGARQLPLAIMTSDDTHARTLELLEGNKYFGMEKGQVTLLKQEKVACLEDGEAKLAQQPGNSLSLMTKPHGHGDVHALLHSSGLLSKWVGQGLKWVCFFQDTNALVFRALPAALGVSSTRGYDVNSLAVPRRAKEAIGAIALLKPTVEGSGLPPLTCNVEYNQLDPLLRATVNPEGDVNDDTGYSPFPGNINQLVLRLSSYQQCLEASKGAVPEFVNPKYKDASRTAFKSPTRLECMMQDLPRAMPASSTIGFTVINQVWATYSPVKNSPADARVKGAEGNPTHSATTGELDMYRSNCLLLKEAVGANIAPPQPATFNGLPLELYPRVSLAPSFASSTADVKDKVAKGSVTVGSGAVLVVEGSGVRIEGLEVGEGSAVVIRACEGAQVVVRGLSVNNKGWSWEALQYGEGTEEEFIRGFKVVRHETAEFVFDTPGQYTLPATSTPPTTTAAAAAAAATAALAPKANGKSAPNGKSASPKLSAAATTFVPVNSQAKQAESDPGTPVSAGTDEPVTPTTSAGGQVSDAGSAVGSPSSLDSPPASGAGGKKKSSKKKGKGRGK